MSVLSERGRIWSHHAVKLPCLDHQHRIVLIARARMTQKSVQSTLIVLQGLENEAPSCGVIYAETESG